MNVFTSPCGFATANFGYLPVSMQVSKLKQEAMVEISNRISIRFEEEKPILIPETALVESHGHKWLRLRPTNQQIVMLLCGPKAGKNASLTSCTTIQELVNQRNEAWTKETPEGPGVESMFEEEKATKKRKVSSNPEIVSINVGGTEIECLMQGQRPSRSDLIVPLKEEQLTAILNHIRPGATEALASAKSKKDDKVDQTKGQEGATSSPIG